jgi:hypothetical protein
LGANEKASPIGSIVGLYDISPGDIRVKRGDKAERRQSKISKWDIEAEPLVRFFDWPSKALYYIHGLQSRIVSP